MTLQSCIRKCYMVKFYTKMTTGVRFFLSHIHLPLEMLAMGFSHVESQRCILNMCNILIFVMDILYCRGPLYKRLCDRFQCKFGRRLQLQFPMAYLGTNTDQWQNRMAYLDTNTDQWQNRMAYLGTNTDQWQNRMTYLGTNTDQWQNRMAYLDTNTDQWQNRMAYLGTNTVNTPRIIDKMVP